MATGKRSKHKPERPTGKSKPASTPGTGEPEARLEVDLRAAEPPPTLRYVLLGAAAAAALLALLPWTPALEGGRFFWWDIIADPLLLLADREPESRMLLVLTVAWLPPAGVALLLLGRRRLLFSDPARRATMGWLAAGIPLVPLYLLFIVNPALLAPLHLAPRGSFLGIPSAIGIVLFAAGGYALYRAENSFSGRVALAGGAISALTATLLPYYAAGEWSLPLFRYLTDALAAGTVLETGRAGVVVLLLAAAVIALLSMFSGLWPRGRAARWRHYATLAAGGSLPLWGAIQALDRALATTATAPSAIATFSLTIAVAAFCLWATVSLGSLLIRRDAVRHEAETPPDDSRHGLIATRMSALEWAVVTISVLLFWLLKTHGLHASATDENIYFYGAHLLSQGVWPYRDFFFAHPPLHLVVPALLFALFGFDLLLAKLISVVASLLTGLCLLDIGRRYLGKVAGITALIGFLFGYQVLQASTNLTGINLTTMWMVFGLWAFLRRRFLLAGIMLALSICTGFYAIAAALALLCLAFFYGNRRQFFRLVASFSIVALLINGVFLAIGGEGYLDGVYRYHLAKIQRDLLPEVLINIYYHPLLIWSFLVAPPLAFAVRALRLPSGPTAQAAPGEAFAHARSAAEGALGLLDPRTLGRGRPEDALRVIWLSGAALGLEFAMFRELYSFYFTLWFPTLALTLGYLFQVFAISGRAAIRAAALGRPLGATFTLALVAYLCVCLATPVAVTADATLRSYQAERIRTRQIRTDNTGFIREHEDRGEVVSFEWTEPAVWAGLADVVKLLFWRGERVRGSFQPGYAWYLRSKKREFTTAPEIAAYVAEHTEPHETITGASAIAPLIALLSGRRLAGDVVDTNNKRFRSGMFTHEEFFEEVCADELKFVIAAPMSAFTPRMPSNHNTVNEQFRPAKIFRDPGLRHWQKFPILLFERTSQPDVPGGPVCRYIP